MHSHSPMSSNKSKRVHLVRCRCEENTLLIGTLRLWFSTPNSYLLSDLLSAELPAKSLHGRLRDALLSTNPPLYHNTNWTFVLEMLSEGTYGVAAIHPVAWTAMNLFSKWCNVSLCWENGMLLRNRDLYRSVTFLCPCPMSSPRWDSLLEKTTHAFCRYSRTLSRTSRRCLSRSQRATEIIY